jgi:ABC-type Mn2+/Zn2+ transport system permease subunit
MKTWDYLMEYPGLFWPPVIAAACLGVLCAWLSVLVVLKRLAFIGQGISHAGFGGIGIAAVLGLATSQVTPGGAVAQFGVVLAFCIAAALAVGFLAPEQGGKAGGTHEDTAIGIVLVVSMALGSILVRAWAPTFRWEDFLFGYLMNTGWPDAAVAAVVTAGVVGTLWAMRRAVVFWSFDAQAAEAFGVPGRVVRTVLMVLLALATVTAMRLAGVVLASALLILPGAAALKMSDRSGPVMALALAGALAGVVAGLVLAFEIGWPPGPAIVVVLTGLFAGACGWRGLRMTGRGKGAHA